jgi:hypothetical protein
MRLTRLFVVLSIFCGLAYVTPASAQERTAVNSVFAEGLGPGLLYSLNYERTLENDFGLRLGVSYMSFGASVSGGSGTLDTASVSWFSVPLVASYLGIASGNNVLELGLGGIFTHASGNASGGGISATGAGNALWGTAVIGYRRQPVHGGFMFRVGMSALIGEGLGFDAKDPGKIGVVPWPYLSLGSTF